MLIHVKEKCMEWEAELWAKYKVEMVNWKKKGVKEKKPECKEHEAMAMQVMEVHPNKAAAWNVAQTRCNCLLENHTLEQWESHTKVSKQSKNNLDWHTT